MVNVGGIVSVGGSSGGSSGSTSGITSINGQTGPAIIVTGVNGAVVTANGNTITIDTASLSGLIGNNTQSGVIAGNGIIVEQAGGNFVVSTSGSLCYSSTFLSIISATFTHNLGTTSVIANVFDSADKQILPDEIQIIDTNSLSISFNSLQSGKIVIVACGGNNTNLEEARRYALLIS